MKIFSFWVELSLRLKGSNLIHHFALLTSMRAVYALAILSLLLSAGCAAGSQGVEQLPLASATALPATQTEPPVRRVTVLPSATVPTATLLPSPTRTAVPSPTQAPPPPATRTPLPTLEPISLPGGTGLVLPLGRANFRALYPQLDGEVHLFLTRQGSATLLPLTEGLQVYNSVLGVSPDGSRILAASFDAGGSASLYVVPVSGGSPILLPKLYQLELDPGARFLTDDWVVLVSEEAGERAMFAVNWLTLEQRRISPVGERVTQLFDTPGSDLYMVWKTGGTEGQGLARQPSSVRWGTLDGSLGEPVSGAAVYPSPDGRNIVLVRPDDSGQPEYFMLTGPASTELTPLPIPLEEPGITFGYEFTWSPDSARLLVSSHDQAGGVLRYTHILSLPDYRLVTLPETAVFQVDGAENAIYPPRAIWAPGGQRIAITNGCRLVVLEISRLALNELQLPCGRLSVFIAGLLWSPDGKHALVDYGTVPQVLDIASMQLSPLFQLPSYPERYPDLTAGMYWVSP